MWKCKGCGRTFPLPARKSVEKSPPRDAFNVRRVILETPCCPFCESIEFEELKSE